MEKMPPDLRKVLSRNANAMNQWSALTPLARRDFVSWIESAKQQQTRKRRVESVPSRLASGKRRPCCYALVPMNLYKSLSANKKAKLTWKSLTPNGKRDFVDWIDSAKGADMHAQRIDKAILLLAAGKRHP